MINGLLSLHISRPGVCKGCRTDLDIFVVLFKALNLNIIVKVDKFMLKLWPPLCYQLKLKFTNTPIAESLNKKFVSVVARFASRKSRNSNLLMFPL